MYSWLIFSLIFLIVWTEKTVADLKRSGYEIVEYEYSDVTVYTVVEKDSYQDPDWTTYCMYPKLVIGLLCGLNQTLAENKTCVDREGSSIHDLNWVSFYTTYLYFHPLVTYDERVTMLQHYGATLMTNPEPFSVQYEFTDYTIIEYSDFIFNFGLYYYSTYGSALFTSFVQASDGLNHYVFDYQCSYQSAMKYLTEMLRSQLLSSHFLFGIMDASFITVGILLVLYLMHRKLRSSVNGKCLIIYLTVNVLQFSIISVLYYSNLSDSIKLIIIGYARSTLSIATFVWLNILCYDTFKIIRGNLLLRDDLGHGQCKQLLHYCIYGVGIPILHEIFEVIIRFTSFPEHLEIYIFFGEILLVKLISVGFFILTFLAYWRKTHNSTLTRLNLTPQQMPKWKRIILILRMSYLFCLIVLSLFQETANFIKNYLYCGNGQLLISFCKSNLIWLMHFLSFSSDSPAFSGIFIFLYVASGSQFQTVMLDKIKLCKRFVTQCWKKIPNWNRTNQHYNQQEGSPLIDE